MKAITLALLTIALVAPMGLAQAQTTAQTTDKAKATTKAAPKKAAAKHRKVPARTAKAVEAVTPVASLSDRLTDAELKIAQSVYTGKIPCELGASVTVAADEKNPGFFNVSTGKHHYYMHPVESRTGALRMEDNRAGAMWLQLGNKSMLMDQKLGQRLADACASPVQQEVAAQLQTHPQPALFDAPKP